MTPLAMAEHATRYPEDLVFKVTFKEFSVRLTTMAGDRLQFQIDDGVYARTEVVPIAATCLRPGLFLVSWTERSGATVVHVEDFENHTVHSHATLPDGSFLRMAGPLTPVTAEVRQ